MSNDQLVLVAILVLVAALEGLCLFLAARSERRHRLLADLPTAKTTGVFIGLVELNGRAEAAHPLSSPLAGTACVWHRWSVRERWEREETEHYTDSDGKSQTRIVTRSGWDTVASGGEEISFELRDDHGAIRIQPAGASVEPVEVFDVTCGPGDPLYFAKGPAGELAHSDHRRSFCETAIPVGTALYVVGQARECSDRVAAEIARDPHAPLFLISTRSERAVSSGYRWAGIGWGLAGLVPFAVLGYLAADQGRSPAAWQLPAGGAVGYLAAWGFAWLWMAYNSLIELRQRVRQAWANIDVQLKRRADLIPNLVRLVEAVRGHEHDVQEHLALLRSQLVVTAPGAAGPDARGCAATVRALAERYPELRADQAFTALAGSLGDCEERVALARAYFNDIATFMNTRLEAVPDRFVAALAGLRAQPLMAADGFERAAPAVRMGDGRPGPIGGPEHRS
jgi:hypothetical protein